MSPLLFDPLDPPENAWPETRSSTRVYIEEIAKLGVKAMVSNVTTKLMVLRSKGEIYPVTINDSEVGDSYVCLPHSAYILYGQQELDLVDIGWLKRPMRSMLKWADGLLLRAGINKIIHIDNWLLSTNLHGDRTGEDLPAIRRRVKALYPDHIIAIRSLDPWSCPTLMDAAKTDNWTLLPSRQIWVTDDMKKWRRKNSTRNDARLLRKTSLKVEEITNLMPDDAERIAELYYMLYVGKYSPLNPVFTPEYIEMTLQTGLFTYRGARDETGKLMVVAGSFIRGGILTPPIVGYDTTRPQSEGLYRIACFLFSEFAANKNLRLNGSAGASQFKKHRGATNMIESTAMYIRHLPFRRKVVIHFLGFILNRLAVPMMKRKEL